jgi:hypothetical protein
MRSRVAFALVMPFYGCADLQRGHDKARVREEQADMLDCRSEEPNPTLSLN